MLDWQCNCTLGATLTYNVKIFVSLFTSLQPLIALEQRKSLNFYWKQFCASFILCLNSHIHLTLSAQLNPFQPILLEVIVAVTTGAKFSL